MKNNAFRLTALAFCLMLLASIAFADKGDKEPPSRATGVGDKPGVSRKKEQPKPMNEATITPAQLLSKEGKQVTEIIPAKLPGTQILSLPAIGDKDKHVKRQLVCSGTVLGGTSSKYQLGWAPGDELDGTVGQLAAGSGSSETFGVGAGFWQGHGEYFLRGDANGDGEIAPGDIVYLINYLFRNGPAPDPLAAGDANCDGSVAPGDVVYLINYLFRNGPPPSC